MTSGERRAAVQEQLDLLLTRCAGPTGSTTSDERRFYDPARGYVAAAEAGEEPDRFGISVVTVTGEVFGTGDWEVPFALQSISKVFTYAQALADNGRDHVLTRVGVDPSGEAFNSIDFDERHRRPFHPMVNAGALVTADLVHGADPAEKYARVQALLHACSANPGLGVDQATWETEFAHDDRNRAAAYLMRSEGMLDSEVDDVLETYLRLCSVDVTARDLAVMAATLANGCVNPLTGKQVLPRERGRDVLSVMYTCGMYDAAGQWACDVGVPAKSGVSGGLMAVIPGKMGIAVWSPGLDEYGNSVRGVRVCREFSERLGLHVFASEDEDVLGVTR